MAFFCFFKRFCRSVMITSIPGSIHQGHEAFNEYSRGLQCAFMSLAAQGVHSMLVLLLSICRRINTLRRLRFAQQ